MYVPKNREAIRKSTRTMLYPSTFPTRGTRDTIAQFSLRRDGKLVRRAVRKEDVR